MTTLLLIVVVLALVLWWDQVRMAADFVRKEMSTERAELGWLRLQLALLKGVAKAIGQTEDELKRKEAEAGAPQGRSRVTEPGP